MALFNPSYESMGYEGLAQVVCSYLKWYSLKKGSFTWSEKIATMKRPKRQDITTSMIEWILQQEKEKEFTKCQNARSLNILLQLYEKIDIQSHQGSTDDLQTTDDYDACQIKGYLGVKQDMVVSMCRTWQKNTRVRGLEAFLPKNICPWQLGP